MPALMAMTIAATRIYRSLVDYVSSGISHSAPLGCELPVSDSRCRSGPVPTRTEVSVVTERRQYATTEMNPVSHTGTDPHGCHKVYEIGLIEDVEHGGEK